MALAVIGEGECVYFPYPPAKYIGNITTTTANIIRSCLQVEHAFVHLRKKTHHKFNSFGFDCSDNSEHTISRTDERHAKMCGKVRELQLFIGVCYIAHTKEISKFIAKLAKFFSCAQTQRTDVRAQARPTAQTACAHTERTRLIRIPI